MKRKLEELNLMDDFLFGELLSYPQYGEEFARALLETIFGRRFGRLVVVPQKTYFGMDTDKHGARLDVFIEEREDQEAVTAVYHMEAQKRKLNLAALLRRMRFYHAKIDSASLGTDEEYEDLRMVISIVILPYDPLGAGRMVYTIKNCCMEQPELPYEDGARTLFLYTKGTKGDPPEALRQMLRYFEDTRAENVENETLKEIHYMVEHIRKDKGVSSKYMLWGEHERELRAEGREEERQNTERERRRAEIAEARVAELTRQVQLLKEQRS